MLRCAQHDKRRLGRCGGAEALPHPVTLSEAKGLEARLAGALREVGRLVVSRGLGWRDFRCFADAQHDKRRARRCGVAGALPHPVTLSEAKGLKARLAGALREAGRLVAAQRLGRAGFLGGDAARRPYVTMRGVALGGCVGFWLGGILDASLRSA